MSGSGLNESDQAELVMNRSESPVDGGGYDTRGMCSLLRECCALVACGAHRVRRTTVGMVLYLKRRSVIHFKRDRNCICQQHVHFIPADIYNTLFLCNPTLPPTVTDIEGVERVSLRNALVDILCGCDWKPLWDYLDKGAISNIITFVIMIIGVVGAQMTMETRDGAGSIGWLCIQAIGLFGFSGGVTNW